jgi:hypothetical protein
MASLTDTILEKIKTHLDASATLNYVNDSFIVPNLSTIPNVSFDAPIALIYPLSTRYVPICMPDEGTNEEGHYQVGISVLQEWWEQNNIGMIGNTNHKGVAEIEADLRSVFNRNLLDDIVLIARFTGASFSANTGNLQGLSQVHVTLEYYDEG